jgi:hypothetical protein
MRIALTVLGAAALASGGAASTGVVFTAQPGQVLEGSVALAGANNVAAVDATTRNSTGIAYLTSRASVGTSRWITVGRPEGDGTVPFTIRIPRGAAAGQYFAGIAAAPKRVAGIEVDVAGPLVARFVLGALNVGTARGHQQLYLHVSNTGNVARSPQGDVSIQTGGGVTLRRAAFRMARFLPHTAIDYPLPPGPRLQPGTYVAVVRLSYPDASGAGAQTSSAAPPFTVSARARAFRPRPATTTPAPTPATESGGSAWPWIGVAGGGALLLGVAGYLVAAHLRRRPLTVDVTPVEAPAPALAAAPCAGHHYWQVNWDSAEPDGTYVHRCRRCGLEVRARDIGDAATRAEALG